MKNEDPKFVFCEACGEPVLMPRYRQVHLLCPVCLRLPRQIPSDPRGRRATLRELFGLREEPRARMCGENWK